MIPEKQHVRKGLNASAPPPPPVFRMAYNRSLWDHNLKERDNRNKAGNSYVIQGMYVAIYSQKDL